MQPEQDYHSLPPTYVSQSSLKVFMKNPVDYKHQFVDRAGSSGGGTPNMYLGSLVHCMVLEPNEVEKQYYVFREEERPEPDKGMTSNKNKAWKAEIELDCWDRRELVISKDTYDKADAIVKALCAHKMASQLLWPDDEDVEVLTELAVIWQSDVADMPLKSKLDRVLINRKKQKVTVLDYKTSSAVNMDDFGWSVKKYGYDIQAAFYEDAVKGYLQEHYPGEVFEIDTLFIPQRTSPPYQVLGVVKLDEQTMEQARTKYKRALQELEGCLHTGVWEEEDSIKTLSLVKPVDDLLFPETELNL